ncbi:MAG: hypothetical protein D6772_03195, partial [Bacteroidetes bacterium]
VDMVAHTSVKTPTAAAEFLLQRLGAFEQTLYELGVHIQRIGKERLAQKARQLDVYTQQARAYDQVQLKRAQWQLESLAKAVQPAVSRQLKAASQKLSHLAEVQALLDVAHTLARGYALVRNAQGLVNSKNPIASGDSLRIRYHGGEQEIEVK